jgi:hypothetical protein
LGNSGKMLARRVQRLARVYIREGDWIMGMDHFGMDAAVGLWLFAGIQGLGLVAALLSRVAEGSSLAPWFQWLFLVTLLATGIATMFAPQIGGGYWLLSAATLGVMVLVAVCDFRQDQRAFML